ncbi:MAG TPA: pyridoxal 5'-phosphate synthase glutaminase subunit PdxT [Firmicutes bacterium]|nr:pyridoxal 5'-phosphate synthase glutaminase subunit PdxT [Bacillota bacterium]
MKLGVLALQGSFIEHARSIERCGARAVAVRKPEDLEGIEGLIIPGGESTTIGKLMTRYGLDQRIRELAAAGMPVYGTCAGLILLARRVLASSQPVLGMMDITVMRNAYGRQVDSFEADLRIPAIGDTPFRGVFIRAPRIEVTGPGVEVLAELDGKPVLARQGRFLVSSFHPELTGDARIHRYFLNMVSDMAS